MEAKSIYQKLDREPSKESKIIAMCIDKLGTEVHAEARNTLRKHGWKVDCWELVGKEWIKTSGFPNGGIYQKARIHNDA
jgi:hypothetical protein